MEAWIDTALSEEQKLPFAGTKDHASILAAAGSGKTRTLIHLLAQDLCSGIPASGIVAFTFTDKAAEELLARIHVLGKEKMPTVDLSGGFGNALSQVRTRSAISLELPLRSCLSRDLTRVCGAPRLWGQRINR